MFDLEKNFILWQRIFWGDAWTLHFWSVMYSFSSSSWNAFMIRPFFFFFPSWEQFFRIILLEEIFASRNKAFFFVKKKGKQKENGGRVQSSSSTVKYGSWRLPIQLFAFLLKNKCWYLQLYFVRGLLQLFGKSAEISRD